MSYPFYTVQHGPRTGVHEFIYVTLEEYEQFGEDRAKVIEYDRIRSRKTSADPELRAKWAARRKFRRNTEPGLRERERELERDRRRRMTLAGK